MSSLYDNNTTESIDTTDTSIVYLSSDKDIIKFMGVDKDSIYHSSSAASSLLKSGLVNYTYTGYDSYSIRPGYTSNYKTMFTSSYAKKIGVSAGTVYFVDFYVAKTPYFTYDSSSQFPAYVESTSCGTKPDGSGEKGYTMYISSSTQFYMATYVLLVKYNLLGQTINKWYPANPSTFVWNYAIYKM